MRLRQHDSAEAAADRRLRRAAVSPRRFLTGHDRDVAHLHALRRVHEQGGVEAHELTGGRGGHVVAVGGPPAVELLDEGLSAAVKFREAATAERAALAESRGREVDQPTLTPEEMAAADAALAYSCIKFADLSQSRVKDYVFSYKKMLDPTGKTAVYLAYAYARMKQIMAQPETRDLDLKAELDKCGGVVPEGCPVQAFKLAVHIARFPETIRVCN